MFYHKEKSYEIAYTITLFTLQGNDINDKLYTCS